MTPTTYLNFDLLVETLETGYRARLLASPAGETSVTFNLPFSALEVENLLLRIGRPRRGVRRLDSPEMHAAKDFGSRLFENVFVGDLRASLRSSLDSAQQSGAGLRLRLLLDEAPQLAELPWEYLYNPGVNRFLGLSIETPIVRYLKIQEPIQPLKVAPPLRMLVMIASPTDFPGLDIKAEQVKLREALSDLVENGVLTFETMEDATLQALQQRLRRDKYHIFHFIGHGGYDPTSQDGMLLFETEQETGRRVSGQDLGTILHDHRSLRLAVLNACEGARASRTDPFAGVAQSLVQQGIPAVIAMQFEITDVAAITFAHELYAAVADGYPVDAALAEARKSIFVQGNDTEWGTPVLYMRSPDGRIFDLPARERTGPHPVVEPGIPPESLEKLYTEGLSHYYTGNWSEAVECFSRIASLQSDYEDVAAKLDAARRMERLTGLEASAAEAVKRREWDDAIQQLQAIVGLDPNNADAAAALLDARRQKRLGELYDEARQLAHAKSWQATVNVMAQIYKEAAQYPDPDGILELARSGLEVESRSKLMATDYALAVRLMNEGQWEEAHRKLEEICQSGPYLASQALLARAKEEIDKNKREAVRKQQEARQELDRNAERLRSWLSDQMQQAWAHFKARRWQPAIDRLSEIRKAQPDYVHPVHGSVVSLLARARELAAMPEPPTHGLPGSSAPRNKPKDLPR